jgi:hypothetical protein
MSEPWYRLGHWHNRSELIPDYYAAICSPASQVTFLCFVTSVPKIVRPGEELESCSSTLRTIGQRRLTPTCIWDLVTRPNAHLSGRAIPYSMAKFLAAAPVLMPARGHKADWDFYAAEFSDQWWRSHCRSFPFVCDAVNRILINLIFNHCGRYHPRPPHLLAADDAVPLGHGSV